DIPTPLRLILARALERDRAQRYPTAEDLSADLEAFILSRTPALGGDDLAALLPDVETPSSPAAIAPAAPATVRDPASKPTSAPSFWDQHPALDAETKDIPRRSGAPPQ